MCDENDYNYLSKLTNEELVDYIQLTNEEKYWEALYKKTEGAIAAEKKEVESAEVKAEEAQNVNKE